VLAGGADVLRDALERHDRLLVDHDGLLAARQAEVRAIEP
jgi:hypothetical protein